MLNEKDVLYLTDLTERNITKSLLKELFLDSMDKKKIFNTDDRFTLDLVKFGGKGKLITTVGRYIANLHLNGKTFFFFKLNGYINVPVNDNVVEDMDSNMSDGLLNDVMTSKEYIDYINRRDWLGYTTTSYLSPSMTSGINQPNDKVLKRKKELFASKVDELEKTPVKTVVEIENELLALAKKELKDDPSMDIFTSGARGSFNNNYKVSNIMRGIIVDPENQDIDISMDSLVDGVKKEDFHKYPNIAVSGSFSKAKDVVNGGVLAKKYNATYQTITLGEKDSDCKTKGYMEVVVTKNDYKINAYSFRYLINDDESLTLLKKEDIKDLIGKKVKLRSVLYCKADKYCNKCSGDLYHNLGVENVGLLFSRAAGKILNAYMKTFHDLSVKTQDIVLDDLID